MHLEFDEASLLLHGCEVGCISDVLPMIEETERICCSGGAIELGEYLSFLRIFAERKPYF